MFLIRYSELIHTFDKSTKGWVSVIHPDWREAMNDYYFKGSTWTQNRV